MKRWKIIILMCVIFFILGIIVENIWVTNDFIWNIGKIMIIGSFIVGVITLITEIFLIHKEDKKMPIWVDIIIAIVIAFIVIFILGNYYSNKRDNIYKEQYEENYNKTKSSTPNSNNSLTVKSFNDVASEYNMTSEELESAIEQ